MFDGLRSLALVWIMYLGITLLSFNGSLYNIYQLDHYMKDLNYIAVYGDNLAYDEFFMISAFFLSLKVIKIIESDP